jgi:hypothetical protein
MNVAVFFLMFSIYGGMIMKRFMASVVLAIALLTSSVIVTQYSMVGTAYAEDGCGSE